MFKDKVQQLIKNMEKKNSNLYGGLQNEDNNTMWKFKISKRDDDSC